MRRISALSLTLVLLALFPLSLHASTGMEEVNTPIKTVGAPAIDLQNAAGVPIGGRDEAAQLSLSMDISKLDPIPSEDWQPTSLSLSNAATFNYPPENSVVDYAVDLWGSMNFRAQVKYRGKNFRLIIDLDNHKSLLAAAMLRKLGYPVDSPQYYPKLRVRFPTLEVMEKFIEDLPLETGFSRDSWIVRQDLKNLTVDLRSDHVRLVRHLRKWVRYREPRSSSRMQLLHLRE